MFRPVRVPVWVLLAACGSASAPARAPRPPTPAPPEPAPAPVTAPAPVPAPPPVAQDGFPDLASALVATIPDDTRIVGFGELHARTDRAKVASALARFTDAIPA